MGLKKRQVVVVCSIIYLAILTGLASYAMYTTTSLNLPISNLLSAFAIALPPLAGVAMETIMALNDRLAARGQIQTSRIFQVTTAFFLIVETALGTMAAMHVAPLAPPLQCRLNERWQQMYNTRGGDRIRRIQDTLDCCGFNDLDDRAFPFNASRNDTTLAGSGTCEQIYGRDTACRGPWWLEERKAGAMLVTVAVGVFVWMIMIVLAPSSQSSWLPSQIRLPTDEESSDTAVPHRARNHPATATRAWDGSVAEDDSLRRVVDTLNEDSKLATRVESNRSGLSVFYEANQWQQARRQTT